MTKKKPKLVNVYVVNGTQQDSYALGVALKELRDKMALDYEFLVTNDKIQLRDVKYLIDELYKLYKQYKKIKGATKKGEKK